MLTTEQEVQLVTIYRYWINGMQPCTNGMEWMPESQLNVVPKQICEDQVPQVDKSKEFMTG